MFRQLDKMVKSFSRTWLKCTLGAHVPYSMIFQMIPADMYFTSCIYESRVLPVKPFNKRFFPTTLVVLFNEFWETENSLLLIWLCRSSGIINRITTRPREPLPPTPSRSLQHRTLGSSLLVVVFFFKGRECLIYTDLVCRWFLHEIPTPKTSPRHHTLFHCNRLHTRNTCFSEQKKTPVQTTKR